MLIWFQATTVLLFWCRFKEGPHLRLLDNNKQEGTNEKKSLFRFGSILTNIVLIYIESISLFCTIYSKLNTSFTLVPPAINMQTNTREEDRENREKKDQNCSIHIIVVLVSSLLNFNVKNMFRSLCCLSGCLSGQGKWLLSLSFCPSEKKFFLIIVTKCLLVL